MTGQFHGQRHQNDGETVNTKQHGQLSTVKIAVQKWDYANVEQ